MRRRTVLIHRLTLLGLCLTFVLIAVNPALRWAIVRSGHAVTGANVEVRDVRADLWNGQVAVSGFAAADPAHLNRNLFDIGRVVLHLDRSRLLHRQFVVTRAEVADLRLATERAEGSALTESASADYLAELRQRYARQGRAWLESTAEQLHAPAKLDLPSAQLVDQLVTRWPDELDRLEHGAIALRSELIRLREHLESSGTNPLRNATSYQTAVGELQRTERQLEELHADANRVEQQIRMDQEALKQSQVQELDQIQPPRAIAPIRADALTEYLLGRDVSDNIVSIIYWMRWGRQFLPNLSQQGPTSLTRGENVWFAGISPEPRIIIRDVILRGAHGCSTGERYHFEGRIQGLSSQPGVGTEPVQIVAQTTSESPCLVEATLRADGKDCESLIRVNCPRLQVPAKQLGDENQLALEVAPGKMHLWMELKSCGDKLTGEVILKRAEVTISTIVASEFQCSETADVFAAAADAIQRIEAHVNIGGTLDRPTWSIHSNLGAEFSQNLQQHIAHALLEQRREQARCFHADVNQRVDAMTQQLASKRNAVNDLLASGASELGRVRERIASRAALTDALLEPDSPLRESVLK